MHRSTPRTEALPAAHALRFLILIVASGCAGDRPTFGQRIGTGDGGSPDATVPSGEVTEPPDAANSTAAEIDANGMSEVNDASVVESDGGDGAVDRANIDASQAVESRDRDASVQKTEGDSWSVFAQVLWDITDQLELSVGGRFTHDEKEGTQQNIYLHQFFELGGTFVPVGQRVDADFEDEHFSPEVTLTWRPTDQFSAPYFTDASIPATTGRKPRSAMWSASSSTVI